MPSVTHIAGQALHIAGRTVQRCSLCGAKLCDSKGASMPTPPDGSEPRVGTFPFARLVRETEVGEGVTRWLVLEDTDVLPDDSCIELLED